MHFLLTEDLGRTVTGTQLPISRGKCEQMRGQPWLRHVFSAEASALSLPAGSSTPRMGGIMPHLPRVCGHPAPLGLTWLGWQHSPGWVARCRGSVWAQVLLRSPKCYSFIILAPGGFSLSILKTASHWPSAQSKLKFLILIVHVQIMDSVVPSLPASVPLFLNFGLASRLRPTVSLFLSLEVLPKNLTIKTLTMVSSSTTFYKY